MNESTAITATEMLSGLFESLCTTLMSSINVILPFAFQVAGVLLVITVGFKLFKKLTK